MDFGKVGVDGVVGSEIGFACLASDHQTKQKWYGSGSLKQEGSGKTEGDWRSTKLAKTDDFSTSKAMLLHQQRNAAVLRSNASVFFDGQQQQHMLSFSSPKPELLSVDKNSQNAASPYSYQSVSSCTRTTGYSSASLNGASMHGVLSGTRGPFTPSQWIELEHQALIYKYFTANVPVPSNLLVPIKKALEMIGVCSYSGGLLRPNALRCGSFHLGFSSNADPEPGRCRRTDGKKWRCSRDAVPDQKYCERHMNRGRHRSRKHVEGQSGHAVTAITTTTTTTMTSKLLPNTSSSHMSTMIDGASNDIAFARQQPIESHKGSVPGNMSGLFVSSGLNASQKKQDTSSLSMFSSTSELKSKGSSFSIHEPQYPCEESSSIQFGLVTSESLLNPSQKETSQSLRYFIDDWPKNPSDGCSLSWQDAETQTERTQLSISIPMPPSDFSKSTSSASNEQLKLSPLRLSRELEPMNEGLALGSTNVVSESCNPSQTNWIPVRWENSMGGPLGEVLRHSNNGNECRKNYSGLNLMPDGWDSSSSLGSSPTGVLQKMTFRSLSNSTGSSPRAENRKQERASLCNDLLGSTMRNSSSFAAL